MKKLSNIELVELIKNARNTVLICGAGISFGAAPLAQDLKEGLLGALTTLAGFDGADQLSSQAIFSEIKEDYLTLELLVSFIVYRAPELKPYLSSFYKKIFSLKKINRANQAIANAIAKGKIRSVLTANFDNGILKSLDQKSCDYSLITDANVHERQPTQGDICAFHGTIYMPASSGTELKISGPTSMTARELAHPFIPSMDRYIRATFDLADQIILIGYRGEDFYDLNLCIKDYIGNNSSPESVSKRQKFFCIPHMGQLQSVSSFIRENFQPENILHLTDEREEWIADLFDQLTETKSITQDPECPGSAEVERLFVQSISDDFPVASAGRALVAKQARALLDDIQAGVLAIWSVTEHYRLESLGLSQNEIAAFGRPPSSKQFFGVSVSKVREIQEKYWTFNKHLRDGQPALELGVSLYNLIYYFVIECENGLEKARRPIEKACLHLLRAIGYDYNGLIVGRFETNKALQPKNHHRQLILEPSDDLYEKSWIEADVAGKHLEKDEVVSSVPEDQRAVYLEGLTQIVSWRVWLVPPRENYARASHRPLRDKVELLTKTIAERLKLIDADLDKAEVSVANVGFGASGHAAQCSQRISELLRALGKVGETGTPDFSEAANEFSHLPDIIEEQRRFALKCLEAAKTFSAHKNPRFISAFDALVLASLFNGDIDEANLNYRSAAEYADGNSTILKRVKQVGSRISNGHL